VSPLGYGICAEGVGMVLDRLRDLVPGTPLMVAEFGIGTADDDQRAAYLRDGLEATAGAIERGAYVRGFFHWTAVDNYEWLLGYRPDAAFGLIDADRKVKPSAAVLADAALGPTR
jgi:beta-glucosidase